MGLFDTITCHYPLHGLSDPSSIEFQTKDLECLMNSYTITREGRLIEHCKEYEECPESERPLYGTPEWNRPLGHLRDMLRVKPGSEHDVDTMQTNRAWLSPRRDEISFIPSQVSGLSTGQSSLTAK